MVFSMSAINEFNALSEYLLVHRDSNAKDIVVAFSGVDSPKGKFQYFKQLSNQGVHVIFVNSPIES